MSWFIWMPLVAGIAGGLIGGHYYTKNKKNGKTSK